jgi:hypothetical protein
MIGAAGWCPRRQAERGAVAVAVAIFMVVLLGFFALAFNIGVIMDARAELQNGSDSAALAAARSLNGEASGLLAARLAAAAYTSRHTAFGQALTIDAFGSDLVFGRWHLVASECGFGTGSDCFEPLPTTEPRKITAVKIRNGRDGGSHNAPITLPFGALVGAQTSSINSAAVAVGAGAATVDCALPLVIAECKIVNLAGQLQCAAGNTQRLVFSNENSDAMGFVNMYYPGDSQAPSGTFVADVIRSRKCNPDNFEIGSAKLQNGNDFGKVIEALRGVTTHGQKEDVTGDCLLKEPQTFAVSDAGCPGNPIFQGVQQLVGFVTVKFAGVTDNQGNPLGCPGFPTPVLPGPVTKNGIYVDIMCNPPAGSGQIGGGHAFNSAVAVRLVQ